ncbi:MAG: hypothetical protein Q8P18_16550 [Pseudomonadota bacterium]|nr:hypothetical protein [Pseudomonadota bacterium]
MITNRLYAGLFGAPLAPIALLGIVVSGGDPGFVLFFSGIGLATMGVVLALSVPFVRARNRWQAAPLGAVATLVGGRVVATIGGDWHVRVGARDGPLTPGSECRLHYDGDIVAFASPGHVTHADTLVALVRGARPHVEAL